MQGVHISASPLQGLVSRMELLARLRYVLSTVRPQAPTVIAALQTLARLARHSQTRAYQVPTVMSYV